MLKDDAIKLARESLEKELAHYLEKLWKLFSWTSTILLSIIGGIFALRFRATPVHLSTSNKVLFVAAVVVLSLFAVVQLYVVLSFERKTRNKLKECDQALGIDVPYERSRPDKGLMPKLFFYPPTLILLTGAAVYSIMSAK